MKSLLEYSDAEIALILVGGGVLAALTMCLGLCGLLHGYVCVPQPYCDLRERHESSQYVDNKATKQHSKVLIFFFNL